MNKRHYEHTLPNIRGSLSNTYVIISAENGCDSLVSSGSGYVSRSCADLQGLPRGSGGLLYRQDVSPSGFCLGKQDLAVSGSGIQVFRHLYCFARLVRGYPDVCR